MRTGRYYPSNVELYHLTLLKRLLVGTRARSVSSSRFKLRLPRALGRSIIALLASLATPLCEISLASRLRRRGQMTKRHDTFCLCNFTTRRRSSTPMAPRAEWTAPSVCLVDGSLASVANTGAGFKRTLSCSENHF